MQDICFMWMDKLCTWLGLQPLTLDMSGKVYGRSVQCNLSYTVYTQDLYGQRTKRVKRIIHKGGALDDLFPLLWSSQWF